MNSSLTIIDNRDGIPIDAWIVTGRLFRDDEDMDGVAVRQHFDNITLALEFMQSALYAPQAYVNFTGTG